MKAVIMAGGLGTRLKPLTDRMPKPMLPIHGKPAMEYAVLLLKNHGIIDIAVTLFYFPEMIKNYFKDGRAFGVNLTYFVEDEPMGTAGSVKSAENFLDERFLVVSGDGITDINLSQLASFHQEKKALATMALTNVEDPCQFGIVVTRADGQITRFVEKPKPDEVFSNTINTGIYCLEPKILKYIPKDVKFDFSKNLFPELLAGKAAFYGFKTNGYWCDIGNKEQYQQVHIDINNGLLKNYSMVI